MRHGVNFQSEAGERGRMRDTKRFRCNVWWFVTLFLIAQVLFLFHQYIALREDFNNEKVLNQALESQNAQLVKQRETMLIRRKLEAEEFEIQKELLKSSKNAQRLDVVVTQEKPEDASIRIKELNDKPPPRQRHQTIGKAMNQNVPQMISDGATKGAASVAAANKDATEGDLTTAFATARGEFGGTWEGFPWRYELDPLPNVQRSEVPHRNACHPELCYRQCESSCGQLPKVVYECIGNVRIN